MIRVRVFTIIKQGIIFAPVCIVFPVQSSDGVPKLYQLKLHWVNDQLNGKHMI